MICSCLSAIESTFYTIEYHTLCDILADHGWLLLEEAHASAVSGFAFNGCVQVIVLQRPLNPKATPAVLRGKRQSTEVFLTFFWARSWRRLFGGLLVFRSTIQTPIMAIPRAMRIVALATMAVFFTLCILIIRSPADGVPASIDTWREPNLDRTSSHCFGM